MKLHQRPVALALLLAAVGAGCAAPPAPRSFDPAEWGAYRFAVQDGTQQPSVDDDGHGLGYGILMYLPNRIFDLLDIVRARLRVGPGIGFTVRATELADLKLGAWTSAYIGLRGPRLEPSIPWPFGLDNYAGAGISVVETESDDYQYGKGEFGVGVHVLLVGADVGVDVIELCDFVLGLVTIDIGHDDY